MPVMKLTKKAIDALPLPDKIQEYYWDPEIRGFGLVVGRTGTKTFVLHRSKRRKKIGRYGPWTPDEARKQACKLIVAMDKGDDPYKPESSPPQPGVTLREALSDYLVRLQSKGASERTVTDMREEIFRSLSDWLDRPVTSITKAECRARHREISKVQPPLPGTTRSRGGPHAANLLFRYFRSICNFAILNYDLPITNPTVSLDWNKQNRRQEPIPWEKLPEWKKTVDTLGPVRRDYFHVVLFTGLRSEDAATIRWDDVDFLHGNLHRPNPKGGADRAFTIPLSNYVLEILRRRRDENKGKDGGLAFPATSWKGETVPVSNRRWGPGKSASPHRLRDTYTTACVEVGLSPFDIDVLTNHRPPKGTSRILRDSGVSPVTAGYVRQDIEHLRLCQEQVTAYILKKMNALE